MLNVSIDVSMLIETLARVSLVCVSPLPYVTSIDLVVFVSRPPSVLSVATIERFETPVELNVYVTSTPFSVAPTLARLAIATYAFHSSASSVSFKAVSSAFTIDSISPSALYEIVVPSAVTIFVRRFSSIVIVLLPTAISAFTYPLLSVIVNPSVVAPCHSPRSAEVRATLSPYASSAEERTTLGAELSVIVKVSVTEPE